MWWEKEKKEIKAKAIAYYRHIVAGIGTELLQ